jgi:prolyl oligopeptidase
VVLAALLCGSGLAVPAVPAGPTAAPAAPVAAVPAPATSAGPPPTAQHDVIETYWGVKVHDPYRWLEDADASAVKQWIEAQNGYTEAVMTGFADREVIAKRVGELALTSTQRSSPQIAGSTLFYLRQTPPQPQPVLVAEDWPQGEPRVLVDPNSAGGNLAITDYWPAPDGRRVAYGTAQGGDENTTIRFIDAADGKEAADALPYAGGGTTPQALAWDADGKGVTYVRLPLPGSVPAARLQFDAELYHHTFGTPANADTGVLGKGFSPIAEYLLFSAAHGPDTAALVHYGDGNPESLYLRTGTDSGWRKALGTEARINAAASLSAGVAWDGERLLVVSYQDAPRGQLLAVDDRGHARVLVPQQEWAMNGVAAVRGGFLVTEVSGPDWRIEQYGADGRLLRTLPLPPSGIGIGAIASTADSPAALISYFGWAQPTRWARYDAQAGTLTTVFEVTPPAGADYSKVRSYALTAQSADGTQVPVTLLALADVRPDGRRPAILTAYGGYGNPLPPRFLGTTLAWLERGGVYAVANIRGGGEYGDGWHEGGRRGTKQHCFDDLRTAAQALIGAHWTDAAHLGIAGGSNGGLLMGAALTQHPGEYRAVVSFVGIYDMMRWELWPNGEYNTGEFGTVKRREEFDWLRAYSPLHHVKPGTAYPAVLLITGENDPRVAPWQSRKFAAALQRANTSQRPILLLTRSNEGHGVTSSFSQRVGNSAAMLAFFAEQLDLRAAGARAASGGGAGGASAAGNSGGKAP